MNSHELRVPSFERTRFGRPASGTDIKTLLANEFFHDVEPALAARTAEAFRIARLPARALIFERWDESSVVFLVLAGRIGLERRGAARRAITVATVDPGHFCGEDAFFPGMTRHHRMDARRREASTISFARPSDLAPVLAEGSAVAFNVARSLYKRLATVVGAIERRPPLS